MTQQVLFLLEDNVDLASRVQRNAVRYGYDVRIARTLERAIALADELRASGTPVAAALVDLMIPKDQESLTKVDDLLVKREELAVNLSMEHGDAKRTTILAKMAVIDEEIRNRILTEGGIQFLESDAADVLRQPTVNVAIFSALRPEEIGDNGSNLSRKERVGNAIGNHWDGSWFEKPIQLRTIRTWLADRATETC